MGLCNLREFRAWRAGKGEPAHLCLEPLRDSDSPLTTHAIAEYLMRAKGLDVNDKPLRARMTEHALGTMRRQEVRGTAPRETVRAFDDRRKC